MADTLTVVLSLAAQGEDVAHGEMHLPPAAPVVTTEGRSGGGIHGSADRVIDRGRAGIHLRVVGKCVSACTLVLALPPDRICAGPNASFGVHKPFHCSARSVPTTDVGSATCDDIPASFSHG